jgi:hypothetical protein
MMVTIGWLKNNPDPICEHGHFIEEERRELLQLANSSEDFLEADRLQLINSSL